MQTDNTKVQTERKTIYDLEMLQGYAPVDYVAAETGISKKKLYKLHENEEVDSIKTEDGRLWIYVTNVKEWQKNHNIKSKARARLAFGSLKIDEDTVLKPLISRHNSSELFQPDRHEYDYQYVVTNTGLVFNLDTKKYLKPCKQDDYYSVKLKKDGKFVNRHVHSLIAYCFCRGFARGAHTVHHIDNNPLNNHCDNLMYVTDKEHGELHSLHRSGNKEAYQQRVEEIQQENDKW